MWKVKAGLIKNGPGKGWSNSLGVHWAQDLSLEVIDVLTELLNLGSVLSQASCGLKKTREKCLKRHLNNSEWTASGDTLPCARASRATATMMATLMAAEWRRPAGKRARESFVLTSVLIPQVHETMCHQITVVQLTHTLTKLIRHHVTSSEYKPITLDSHITLTHAKGQGSPFKCWFKSETAHTLFNDPFIS